MTFQNYSKLFQDRMSIFKSVACKICLDTLRLLGNFFIMLKFRSSEDREGLEQKTVGTVETTSNYRVEYFTAKLCPHGHC